MDTEARCGRAVEEDAPADGDRAGQPERCGLRSLGSQVQRLTLDKMPIGAGDESGGEQIVMLAQGANDGRIYLHPTDPQYRENVNFVPSDTRS